MAKTTMMIKNSDEETTLVIQIDQKLTLTATWELYVQNQVNKLCGILRISNHFDQNEKKKTFRIGQWFIYNSATVL